MAGAKRILFTGGSGKAGRHVVPYLLAAGWKVVNVDLVPLEVLGVDNIVADGTDDATRRLERVLWNDPGTGVMRHADAGYRIAVDCAHEQGLDLPMVTA